MKRPMKIVKDKAKEKFAIEAKDALKTLKEIFSEYEIDSIVAELKAGIPQLKGTLKVIMKRRKKEEK